jgi:predicted  nucleic acid-binding Zn-ribbon protein
VSEIRLYFLKTLTYTHRCDRTGLIFTGGHTEILLKNCQKVGLNAKTRVMNTIAFMNVVVNLEKDFMMLSGSEKKVLGQGNDKKGK